jgi:hypothetical protein
MTNSVHEFGRYENVRAALADRHLVPPSAEAGPAGTVAWLRAEVARFSFGEAHARRRALVEAELGGLDPAELRRAAASGPDGAARLLVVRALADGLGLPRPDAVARSVVAVAEAYFSGGEDPEADGEVAWLLSHVLAAGAEPAEARREAAANRIGLLVQACDATGRLVEHARRASGDRPGAASSVEALLTETLRYDPPVRAMRRVAIHGTRVGGVEIAEGDLVVLDIAAANRDPEVFADPDAFRPERTGPAHLTFGSPPRLCPGSGHALGLAAGILDRAPTAADAPDDDTPVTDDRDPAEAVTAMVDHVLALAGTWTAWDGHPIPADDRVYTPHKAIRRVADHLIDHLAEIEARLAGEDPQPDHWHASAITTASDLAPFTQEDLDEARSRLTRLTRIWTNRLHALTPDQLDHSPGPGWTFRQLAFHLTGSAYYADALGDLALRY